MPDIHSKRLYRLALMVFALTLIVVLGAGADWMWAPLLALLGLVLVKRLEPTWDAQNAYKTDPLVDAHLPGRSPRADMERSWRRLGSARGRLLADADPQPELADQIRRLEYGRQAREYQRWLAPQDRAQAHDLQAPPAGEKRKRKPKRKRLG